MIVGSHACRYCFLYVCMCFIYVWYACYFCVFYVRVLNVLYLRVVRASVFAVISYACVVCIQDAPVHFEKRRELNCFPFKLGLLEDQ